MSRYVYKPDPFSSHSTILSLLPSPAGEDSNLLDVGAAEGFLSAEMTKRGFTVTAIESNPDFAAAAATRCARVIVSDLDVGPLPLEEFYDVIVYGDVLEHLRDPLALCRAINRHLKPGGLVIISLPNFLHLYVRLQVLFGRFEYMDRGLLDRTHMRFFTQKSIRMFLEDAGLEILDVRTTPVPLPLVVPERFHGAVLNVVHSLNATLARVFRNLLAYQFVVKARLSEKR